MNNVENREAAGDVSIEGDAQGGLIVGPRTFTLPDSIPAQGQIDVRDVRPKGRATPWSDSPGVPRKRASRA